MSFVPQATTAFSFLSPIQFPEHGRIARIPHGGINVISKKIEKGRQVGIADSFCVGLIAVCKAV
jgi:hypothetical protein